MPPKQDSADFEPLLPTDEREQNIASNNVERTSQSAQNASGGAQANEFTPLLASQDEMSETGGGLFRRGAGGAREENRGGDASSDKGISSAIANSLLNPSELMNALSRNRPRLNSYPVLPDPEDLLQKMKSLGAGDDQQRGDEEEQLLPEGQQGEEGFGADNIEETAAGQAMGDAAVEGDTAQHNDKSGKSSKYMHVGPGRFWLIFITVLLGYFVACFDVTLMASSHPVITSYFNASNKASWLTTAFMITNTGFQPFWGRCSDLVGRRPVYLAALSIFALTNLWCGLSNSIDSFIAARAICGVGAGGTMSMGLVITNDLVKIEHRGTFISHINVAFGVGAACGAAFGGVICDSIGWRWAFGIQVPIILVCGIAGFFFIPPRLGPMLINSHKEGSNENPAWTAVKRFDNLGLASLVCAVAFFILFFNMGGNEYPWNHPVIIVCLVLGILLSGLVIFVEKRAKQPVMPLHLLVTPPYMNLTYANFLAGVASNTVLFNAPLWFQAVELKTPSASGLYLAAPAIGGSIAGVATGYIITYSRRLKPMLIVGSVVYLAGSIALYFISQGMNEASKVALITPTPLSQGFIYPGSMMAAFAASPQEEQGVVTTTLSLWRNLGIVVGVAISSLVFQNVLNVKLEEHVHGPDAQKYIDIAKSSVRRIKDMPEFYRADVITSYAEALKMSFITAIVASAILLLLMLPMKLPRLRKGEQMNVAGGD